MRSSATTWSKGRTSPRSNEETPSTAERGSRSGALREALLRLAPYRAKPRSSAKFVCDLDACSFIFRATRPATGRVLQIASSPLGRPQAKLGEEAIRSEEHTSELQSRGHLVCRLLLE